MPQVLDSHPPALESLHHRPDGLVVPAPDRPPLVRPTAVRVAPRELHRRPSPAPDRLDLPRAVRLSSLRSPRVITDASGTNSRIASVSAAAVGAIIPESREGPPPVFEGTKPDHAE